MKHTPKFLVCRVRYFKKKSWWLLWLTCVARTSRTYVGQQAAKVPNLIKRFRLLCWNSNVFCFTKLAWKGESVVVWSYNKRTYMLVAGCRIVISQSRQLARYGRWHDVMARLGRDLKIDWIRFNGIWQYRAKIEAWNSDTMPYTFQLTPRSHSVPRTTDSPTQHSTFI